MEIGVMKARPPHLRFINKGVEDRDATIAAGHPVFKDVAHVVITPQGSRDSVEKVVVEWLASTDVQVQEERVPAEWAEKFRAAFEHWKRGEEIPVDGSALVNWPVITAGELQACKAVHILTVEDLAVANDQALRSLGMSGLTLKQRAVKYLSASNDLGKLVAQNEALAAQLKDSEARRNSLEDRIVALEKGTKASSPVLVTPAKAGIEEKL